jgi:hypothetical protein
MSKKNKHYGFPYDYSFKKPIHKFRKDNIEMTFYSEGNSYALLQKNNDHQQRVVLTDVAFNNMLGILDKNGFREIAI